MRFQATDLLGFFDIWGLGFPGKAFWAHSGGFLGKTFWAHSGGFRVWAFRVETFWGLGFQGKTFWAHSGGLGLEGSDLLGFLGI